MTNLPAVHTATEDDLPALRSVARAALVHDDDAQDVFNLLWAQTAARPQLRIIARREGDGAPVGAALAALRPATGTTPATGHIDLLAVHPDAQGIGTGRALLTRAEELLAAAGAKRLMFRGRPPYYAWPGIDIRYTRAVCLAESSGYTRGPEGLNMSVDLRTAPLETADDEKRLAAVGVGIRRLAPEDEKSFLAWMAQWGGSWDGEAARALSYDPPRGHVAVRETVDGQEAFVGFACHGVNRRSWFGPMGTESSERGLGVGTVLLRRCLADQRELGIEEAEIGWTAPIHFYARAVDARLGRVFWTYTKTV
ncbi:GNAT family N-acetyltransferase [Streptomyces beijiangensis]|uniref:GNAT family N-acetyltransferase n=1 Tax=Streptomyces beijiangensis TaxID=163361 RepID=A0A939FED3_9ACTN|nr:GNAT family N-acetyltransferase [Streptomyces beijiangensis]MBO0517585.1 GNAT family N-acetyltransferase [Streptomyces beijiangensis]